MFQRLHHGQFWIVLQATIIMLAMGVLAAAAAPTDRSASWKKLALSGGPGARIYGSAGYDALGQQVLLFGGQGIQFNVGAVYGDLWSLDLSPGKEVWKELKPSGAAPEARGGAALTVDETSRRLVIFGGFGFSKDITYLEDTWSLDLSTGASRWSRIATSGGPDKRYGASLISIPPSADAGTVGRMVLFGGKGTGRYLNDTWVLDLEPGSEKWTKLSATGTPPLAMAYHASSYDAKANRMIVFGGDSDRPNSRTWALSLTRGSENWSELKPTGNVSNRRRTIANDTCPGAESIYMYDWSDVWALSLAEAGKESWIKVSTSGGRPAARSDPASAFDTAGRQLIIFSGSVNSTYVRETWSLKLEPCAVPTVGPSTATPTATSGSSPTVAVTFPPTVMPTETPTRGATEEPPPTIPPTPTAFPEPSTSPSPVPTATMPTGEGHEVYLPWLDC